MPFVKYDPYQDADFGAGDFTDHTGRVVPMYDPGLAKELLANNMSVQPENVSRPDVPTPVIGDAVIEPKQEYVPAKNGKPYESVAKDFLKESGGKLGATKDLDTGARMVVETHPAAPERGLNSPHPGVTVEEPVPSKISPEENKALDELIGKYPNLTKQGLLHMFQQEGGYDPNVGLNPGAVNPKSGAAGIFQLMPSQAKSLGMGDVTKYSAADQIKLYDEYLKSHGAPSDISDADLGLAQAAPAFLGKPDNTLVYPAGSKEAGLNPGWVGPDGNVTVGSIKAYYGGQGGGSTGGPQSGVQDLGNGNKLVTETKNIQTTTEGTPYTAADQKALFERSQQHAQELKDAYQPVIDAQATIQKQQIARQQEIQAAADLAQNREQEARKNYDDSTARVNQYVQEVLNDQAPKPFGGNVFAGILAAIAQGMGTYSAAINKTRNFAMDAINEGLKRENEKWQQNLLLKKYKVDQEKDLNTHQWYDYQTQKTERQAQQRALIDHELQQQLASVKDAETQRSLGLLLEENRNKTEDLNADLQRLARGKVMNQTITDRKVTSGPAVDEKTYQAYMKGEPHKGIYGRGAIDTAEREMQSLTSVLGLNFDPTSATPFTEKPGAPDLISRNPITGSQLGPTMSGVARKLFHSKEEEEKMKEAETRTQTVINAKLYMVSGAQINEQEAARTAGEFQGKSREDQIRNLNMLWNGLQNKKADLDATYPGMATIYETRRPKTSADPYATQSSFQPGYAP